MSDQNKIYELLEKKFLTYHELRAVPVIDNDEPLIDITIGGLSTFTYDKNIRPSTGDVFYARKSVILQLEKAQKNLQSIMPELRLQIFYAYRTPEIQFESFEKMRIIMGFDVSLNDEQREKIHRYIAVPDVAGHPTGAAIDVTITDMQDNILDMGTAPHEFEKDSYTFSPFISQEAWINRQLLRAVMVSAHFAPFDGEWWHFSYGDREWAKYFRKAAAFYAPIELIQ